MTLANRLYSVEDLLSMEEGDAFELDDGVLRQLPLGAESAEVAYELLRQLGNFIEGKGLGRVIPANVGLQIFANRPQRLPRPDGGFIRAGRLPGDRFPKGSLKVAPDTVIESISPNELAGYTMQKIQEYLSAGVKLVWVLYPETRSAFVYRIDGTASVIPADAALEGEDVIPGFRCELATIMPPAEPS
ncbi:MAG: Uma2 family endonuclease [Tepidiformaceae bacterium]